jgi:hypothetical protein
LKLPPSFENQALIYQKNIFSGAHNSGGLGSTIIALYFSKITNIIEIIPAESPKLQKYLLIQTNASLPLFIPNYSPSFQEKNSACKNRLQQFLAEMSNKA